MKTLIIIALLALSTTVQAKVLCRSMSDPTFEQWYGGYSCPAGTFMIKLG